MKKLYLILVAILITSAVNSQIKYDDGPIIPGGNFVTVGTWGRNNISFSFQNGTADIPNDDERNAIRQAFQLWADYGNLNFSEVTSNADIIISWGVGDHGDGVSFDGVNGVLAHAYFPPPGGGNLAGDMHFDDAETWSLAMQGTAAQPMDLVTVAAHEIGHALGLGHSNVACALMNPFYTGSHRYLAQDDIDGIQTIYGNRTVIRNTTSNCSGGTYFISNLPAGANVLWSSSNTLIATVVNNNNQGIVTWTAGQVGQVRITATIQLPCGQNVTEFFDIHYGIPSAITNLSLTNVSGDCYLPFNTYTVNGGAGATNFKWFKRTLPSGSFVQVKNGSENYYTFSGGVAPGSCKNFELKVEATNGCNSTTPITFTKQITYCRCTKGEVMKVFKMVTISPNPATSTVKIELLNSYDSKNEIMEIHNIRITDKMGKLKKDIIGNRLKTMVIDISEFPADLYLISIFDGVQWSSSKFTKL